MFLRRNHSVETGAYFTPWVMKNQGVDIIDLHGRINPNYHSKNRRINQCL